MLDTLLIPLFVIIDAVILALIVASELIKVATFDTSVIALKSIVTLTFDAPLESVIIRLLNPEILATSEDTILPVVPLYSLSVMYADDTASTFVNIWLVFDVDIEAVSTVSPVPTVYPAPVFVTDIALISPLLCKLAVAVATLLPVVGLLIVIVGNPKYLCFASITSILETTPVVSCGNANVISCGSCTTFARLSFNSML